MSDEQAAGSVGEQLLKAVRDLWTMPTESGETFVVFVDRRRLAARVDARDDGRFLVSWEMEDGSRRSFDGHFDNPREAVFRGYQGPH